ncbi:TF protein, partial [Free State vervet virus]
LGFCPISFPFGTPLERRLVVWTLLLLVFFYLLACYSLFCLLWSLLCPQSFSAIGLDLIGSPMLDLLAWLLYLLVLFFWGHHPTLALLTMDTVIPLSLFLPSVLVLDVLCATRLGHYPLSLSSMSTLFMWRRIFHYFPLYSVCAILCCALCGSFVDVIAGGALHPAFDAHLARSRFGLFQSLVYRILRFWIFVTTSPARQSTSSAWQQGIRVVTEVPSHV